MRDPLRLCLVLWLTLGGAQLAVARPFEVPTFAVDPASEVTGPRVAVGIDGTMVLAWQAGPSIRAQLHSQAGAALAAPFTVEAGAQLRLAADTRGGYVVAYTRTDAGHRHLYGRRLDEAGQPVGVEISVDQLPDEDVGLSDVVGLPAGFALH